jgi:hypothetical protein
MSVPDRNKECIAVLSAKQPKLGTSGRIFFCAMIPYDRGKRSIALRFINPAAEC